MFSVLYAIAYPSVCPSVTRVDQSKTVEVRIMQFSPYNSSTPLVFVGCVSPKNSSGFPNNGGFKQGWGAENKPFSSLMRHASISQKQYEIRPKLLLMTNRKLYMRFRLAQRSMTLNDLELL